MARKQKLSVAPPELSIAPPPVPLLPETGGLGMLEIVKILGQVFKFFQDNPEILELIKRLLGRAALGQPVTMAEVVAEAQAVQQLNLPATQGQ